MKNTNLAFYALAGISSMPATLTAGQAHPEERPADKQQPNVILIVADDLGYGDLSCYGAHRISTPGMDRVANEGIRFTQGFCTAATSTPSRYSVMTGLYPWTNTDAKILPGGTAYMTDLGMCGPEGGVLGTDRDVILRRFTTGTPQKFVPAAGRIVLRGALITCDGLRATAIERVEI